MRLKCAIRNSIGLEVFEKQKAASQPARQPGDVALPAGRRRSLISQVAGGFVDRDKAEWPTKTIGICLALFFVV